MQLHSEGWEREEEGRERGAARPAGRMREVAQADPAPSPKRLPGRPTTGPPSLGAPPPAIPPWASSHRAGPWGRVGSPLCLTAPPSSSRLRLSQLVTAAVIHPWTPPQFNPIALVRGQEKARRGRPRRIGEPWEESGAKKRKQKLELIEMFAINCSC